MQTKQTGQKAPEKERRKLNNGFIDLRHVDFIRGAGCIKWVVVSETGKEQN